ncbi:MAG: hypothetical protein HC883_00685 [Bdellovibrionaceae bacterium]|nr:hypothetical protein [Pseudobdellovibrionaceae bacterium]
MKRTPLAFALLAQPAPASDISSDCLSKAKQAAGHIFSQAIAAEFQQTYGLKLDWVEALEVRDDNEGSNCIFSTDSGYTITLPIESVSHTAPNKYFKD